MSNISINALAQKCTALANELTEKGFTVEIDVNRLTSAQGGSCVWMSIESEKGYWYLKVLANGYSAVTDREISTENGWTKAKTEILNRIK